MKRWPVIAAAVLLFLSGLGTGWLLARPRSAGGPPPPPAGGPPEAQLARMLEARLFAVRRLERELDLTPEQRARIEALVQETQGRTRQAWQEMQPRLRDEFRRLREDIRAVLTPEQREQFDRLQRRPRPGPAGEPRHRLGRPQD